MISRVLRMAAEVSIIVFETVVALVLLAISRATARLRLAPEPSPWAGATPYLVRTYAQARVASFMSEIPILKRDERQRPTDVEVPILLASYQPHDLAEALTEVSVQYPGCYVVVPVTYSEDVDFSFYVPSEEAASYLRVMA